MQRLGEVFTIAAIDRPRRKSGTVEQYRRIQHMFVESRLLRGRGCRLRVSRSGCRSGQRDGRS
jgi:hypothetical protein